MIKTLEQGIKEKSCRIRRYKATFRRGYTEEYKATIYADDIVEAINNVFAVYGDIMSRGYRISELEELNEDENS